MVIDTHTDFIGFVKALKRSLPFHIALRDAKRVADVARDIGGDTAMTLLRGHFSTYDALEQWRTVGPERRLLYLGGDKFAWVENDTMLIGTLFDALGLSEVTPYYEIPYSER
jgi:hypothetical protein